MNDAICDVLRDIIKDAIEEAFEDELGELRDVYEGDETSIELTDIGLAVRMGDRLYGIIIEKV